MEGYEYYLYLISAPIIANNGSVLASMIGMLAQY